MDQQRNKDNLQRLYGEVMNGHRVDAADDLIMPDRPDHDPNLPPEFTEDREGFKRLFRMFIAAFPDLSFTSEHMVAEGDLVASYNTMSGTHRGDFMGIPGTGKSFTVKNADVCRFTDEGMIAEHWGVLDMGSMFGQLGVAPPGSARAS
jgi:predicted ester cyclase